MQTILWSIIYKINRFFLYYIQTGAPTIHLLEGKTKLSVEGNDNPSLLEVLSAKKMYLDFELKHR